MSYEILNRIEEASIAFGTITANYTLALDLDANSNLYSHILIESSLDQPTTINFENTSDEKIISADSAYGMDGIQIDGSIKIKHNGAAPTVGSIIITAW